MISGFIGVALLSVVIGYLAINSGQKVRKSHDKIIMDTVPKILALKKIQIASSIMMMEVVSFIAIQAEEQFAAAEEAAAAAAEEAAAAAAAEEEEFLEAKKEVEIWAGEYEKYVDPADTIELQFLKEINGARERIGDLGVEMIALKKKGIKGEEILEMKEKLEEAENNLLELLEKVIAHEKEGFSEEYRIVNQNFVNSRNVVLSVAGLGFLLAVGFGLLIARSISGPIAKLKDAAIQVGKGKFDIRLDIKSKDEIGYLAIAFNKMAEDLEKATEELKSAYGQLKNTQAQLVQSTKMASVGLLAGGVAHEINNPLTGILNNVQLIGMLAEQKKGFSIADFKELLTVVEDSALRCKKITQSLLDFSHASKGVFQPLSINEIIEKVAILIEHELGLQNISIQKDLKPGLPQVQGDSQLLQQVIFDLISNAKWAIQQKPEEEAGLISLRTEYAPQDKTICLSISDNGMGIPKETQEHIFEPFFTTKQVGEGTGLGLSIVYNIVKAHSGTIEVESEVGKGTTFKIFIPV